MSFDLAALKCAPHDASHACQVLGRELKNGATLCPAHDEKHPSCSVRVVDGVTLFRCFSCGFSGTILDGVAAVHGLDITRDFAEVCRLTAELFDVAADVDEVGRAARPAPRSRAAAAAPLPPVSPPRRPLDLDHELASVLLPLDSPHAAEVADYVRSRGLLAEAVVDGWRALDAEEALYQTEERLGLDGDPAQSDLARAGLIMLRDGVWRVAFPANLLTIPWRAPDGSIDTLQRRRLDGESRSRYIFPSGRGPLHLHGVERLSAAPADAPITICEGALDVLALRKLGEPGVVLGLPGVSGWRREWANLCSGRVVRLALDADPAGDAAAERIAADLFHAGARDVLRSTPTGKANDWADAVGGANQ